MNRPWVKFIFNTLLLFFFALALLMVGIYMDNINLGN